MTKQTVTISFLCSDPDSYQHRSRGGGRGGCHRHQYACSTPIIDDARHQRQPRRPNSSSSWFPDDEQHYSSASSAIDGRQWRSSGTDIEYFRSPHSAQAKQLCDDERWTVLADLGRTSSNGSLNEPSDESRTYQGWYDHRSMDRFGTMTYDRRKPHQRTRADKARDNGLSRHTWQSEIHGDPYCIE
jgi:hypothetical protein